MKYYAKRDPFEPNRWEIFRKYRFGDDWYYCSHRCAKAEEVQRIVNELNTPVVIGPTKEPRQ